MYVTENSLSLALSSSITMEGKNMFGFLLSLFQCSYYECCCPLLMFQVIVPLLVTEDEKTLVTCINCLTKVFS